MNKENLLSGVEGTLYIPLVSKDFQNFFMMKKHYL